MADAAASDFEAVLRHLRRLDSSCEPPIGVGSFDVLYASEREVVVWYSPARETHRAGEVAISCAWLAAAWAALAAGEALDEAALEAICGGTAGGRWLLAVLAQLPSVTMRTEPLVLVWGAEEPVPDANEASVSQQSRMRTTD